LAVSFEESEYRQSIASAGVRWSESALSDQIRTPACRIPPQSAIEAKFELAKVLFWEVSLDCIVGKPPIETDPRRVAEATAFNLLRNG